MRVMLPLEPAPHSLGALGPSTLYLREYLVLPLEDFGLHELPRDRLILKGIIA